MIIYLPDDPLSSFILTLNPNAIMKFIKCLSILCSIPFTLIAQKNFDPGYIIAGNQDTVRGFVEVAMQRDLARSVKFKNEVNAELKEFTPADLLGFGIEKEVYKSMRFLNT